MSPKISVLVAAYNIEKYIDKCLASIAKQTYPNFEVIIIDDGSTDTTFKKCQIYCDQHPNFQVYTQKNQGLSAVRNQGLQKSTGEYVVFVDGDDYVSLDYLSKLYESLSKSHSDIAVCNFQTFPANTKTREIKDVVISGEDAVIRLLKEQENYQIVSWNKLYKKTLFDGIKFPVNQLNEDSFTTFKLFKKARKVSFISDKLYFYRQRQQSIMSSIKLNQRLDFKLAAAIEAKSYFNSKPKLYQAAEISELLAYLAFLDSIYAHRLSIKPEFAIKWVKDHRPALEKNPQLTRKLKIYLKMIAKFNGRPYQIFRTIKH